ncbi:MbcA/ParS/Xre antitoxin family protein [Gordonia aquimaris]|uniref:MbcA/ParS/Xre antitoxin family protein n=1 Tax=Gordonia aquimaris TaxID=2984863 RepID=A0A9X3D3A0_9ACTN|nr:MbcA/ParS/Xre antitoxin family protein [Gordonia aquimaris]MCX2962632.1 MbcA/ParS/Xre antitoxin family protein [Gordonia aquimaris]
MTSARVRAMPRSRRPRGADPADPLAPARVSYLADSFGKARLAELIGVSRSQPTRWISGEEYPGPIAGPLLIDLEHIFARARLIWGERAAQTWLISQNVHLGGARPIDALRLSGAAAVLTALDAEAWGGAA